MKSNYHTHTYLCGHAIGEIEDYIKIALESGFCELGFSEHGYLPYSIEQKKNDYPWLEFHMKSSDFNPYLEMIDKMILKYQKITLKKGLEVEYIYGEVNHYKYLLSKLDYLILGIHYIIDENGFVYGTRGNLSQKCLELYRKTAVDGMKSGYFNILAHPDIFLYDYHEEKLSDDIIVVIRSIIQSAIENDVYLEFNCGGIRKGNNENMPFKYYPKLEFWKIVSEYKDVKVIVGLDAHNPGDFIDKTFEIAKETLELLGINYIDKIDTWSR